MRAVVQRVSQARVEVDGQVTGAIAAGLLVLLGVHRNDTDKDLVWMADKIQHLRIFEDEQGLMNRSLKDVHGQLLVVSQFTLYGDCRKGRRPSFVKAAPPEESERLYERFVSQVRDQGVSVATGRFRTVMQVSLVNHGPVTLILETPESVEK